MGKGMTAHLLWPTRHPFQPMVFCVSSSTNASVSFLKNKHLITKQNASYAIWCHHTPHKQYWFISKLGLALGGL